jgi:hypothetical protein
MLLFYCCVYVYLHIWLALLLQAVCSELRQRGVCGYVTVAFVAFWDAKHNTQVSIIALLLVTYTRATRCCIPFEMLSISSSLQSTLLAHV